MVKKKSKKRKPEFSHQKNSEILLRLDYTKDILDKRYTLYVWLNSKVNLSLVINSALLGFSYVLLNNIKNSSSVFIKSLVLISIILIGLSVLLCILLTNPAMKSPLWKKNKNQLIHKQPRTSLGIANFSTVEYHKYMKKINIKEMLTYNIDQILKMNAIINSSSKYLRIIMAFSAIALLLLIISLICNYQLN